MGHPLRLGECWVRVTVGEGPGSQEQGPGGEARRGGQVWEARRGGQAGRPGVGGQVGRPGVGGQVGRSGGEARCGRPGVGGWAGFLRKNVFRLWGETHVPGKWLCVLDLPRTPRS